MIQKGQKINDRYQIIRSIGEGGMANVYLAYDTILDRNVAVKVLRGDLASDEKFVRRFQREAISSSSLVHPNIVEMYDVGEDNGKYFIVMEYLEGQTLKNLIKKRGALTLHEVIDIMLQLTDGLMCAHESYIIHRDIKPQNVVILDDGRVKITDFGIAVALNSNELTQTNSVMGSVHYLPPEQANGNTATIKSDIYSAGILMFELLTGKLPFKGENAVEIAIKQMKEKIPSVRDFNPEIPQSVENIILKACAKNPKNRYDSVREMHDDLVNCLEIEKRSEPKIVYPYPEFEEEEVKQTREQRNEEKNVDEFYKTEEKKVNKALIITIIITAVLGILAIFIFFVLPLITSPKEVTIPDVSSKSVKKATEVLEDLGLKVDSDVEKEESDKIAEGKVIKTNPKSERTVKKGSTIKLIVSKGKEKYEVEDYTGKKFSDVKTILENKGIKVTSEEKEFTKDDKKEEGTIVEQSIKPGEKLEKNSSINFIVVKMITVYPDFVNENYTIEQVETFCEDNGITLEKTAKESDTKEGLIITQSRTAGTKVVSGATLRVTYSIGKKVTPKAPESKTTPEPTTTKEQITEKAKDVG